MHPLAATFSSISNHLNSSNINSSQEWRHRHSQCTQPRTSTPTSSTRFVAPNSTSRATTSTGILSRAIETAVAAASQRMTFRLRWPNITITNYMTVASCQINPTPWVTVKWSKDPQCSESLNTSTKAAPQETMLRATPTTMR